MAEKIKSISVKTTNEQIVLEWGKIISKRNKLLQSSDWTQLEDCGLTPESKNEWAIWRQQIRSLKRHTYKNINDLSIALDNLEKCPPKKVFSTTQDKKEVLQSDTRVIEKIFIKEQPIILQEKIELEDYKKVFFEFFNNDNFDVQQYLKNLLNKPYDYVRFDGNLNDTKLSIQKYLKLKQKEILYKKLENYSPKDIIDQKTEEAVEYLTTDNKDLQDYPLINLYSQYLNITPNNTAIKFLDEKKEYNKIIVQSEKYVMINLLRIENCTTMQELKDIFEELKNGY